MHKLDLVAGKVFFSFIPPYLFVCLCLFVHAVKSSRLLKLGRPTEQAATAKLNSFTHEARDFHSLVTLRLYIYSNREPKQFV